MTESAPKPTMSTPLLPKKTKESESLAWVDALRGIAIIGVMLCHCFSLKMPWRLCHVNIARTVLTGHYGVQLFFVASAFTLARSWHRRKTELNPTMNFLVRRGFRIAPIYIIGLFIYGILAWLHIGPYSVANYTFQNISVNCLLLNGYQPWLSNIVVPGGWSIGVETSFYLLVPFLAKHLRSDIMPTLMTLLLAFAIAGLGAWGAAHALSSSPSSLDLYCWLPVQLPVFLMGFLAYSLLQNQRFVDALAARKKIFSTLFLVICALVLLWISLSLGKSDPPPEGFPKFLAPHYYWLSPSLAGISSFFFLLALALHPWPLFVNRITLFLGKLSYSLYIVHFIAIWVLVQNIHNHAPWPQPQPWGTLATFGVGIVACFAFSIPAAMLTHRFIEKPGIALGKRLIERLENRASQKMSA